MSPLWRIDELAAVVRRALESSDYEGAASARVRSVPDPRTIRYYTTLGLLDKPAEMRGRTAYYGQRHAMQLVAIKRLQADGASLEEVQRQLTGIGSQALADRAALPERFWESAPVAANEVPPPAAASVSMRKMAPAPQRSPQRPPQRAAFWAAAPALSQPAASRTEEPSDVTVINTVELRIAPGIRMLLDGIDAASFGEQELAQLMPAIRGVQTAVARIQDRAAARLESGGGSDEKQPDRRDD